MNKILKILAIIIGVLFIAIGLRWLIDPSNAVTVFGFSLSTGIGLSSQIGDMSGYFLGVGICILIAAITAKKVWYYPAIIILTITAFGRVLAWCCHGADLATPLIASEVIYSLILWLAAKQSNH